MNEFSRDDSTRLIELLGQEIELFRQVHMLTSQQAELLASDDIEAFDRSLDSRQDYIERIDGLHQESSALMQSYVAFSYYAGGEKIGDIEDASGRLRAAISQCAGINDQNAVVARERSEEYIRRINRLSGARKSLGKYAQSVANSSEFIDRKT